MDQQHDVYLSEPESFGFRYVGMLRIDRGLWDTYCGRFGLGKTGAAHAARVIQRALYEELQRDRQRTSASAR